VHHCAVKWAVEMTRFRTRLLTLIGIAGLLMALEACSGNVGVSTGIGIHRSSNGDWGHSISVGVHTHGGNW